MNMDLFSHQERNSKSIFNKLESSRIFQGATFHVVATNDKIKRLKDVYSFLRCVASSYFTCVWVCQHVHRTEFCKNQRAG